MQRSPTLSERVAAERGVVAPAKGRRRRGKLWRDGQKWTRWLHVYTSMIALAVVLFFSVTGLTLNHQDWTFGLDPVSETLSGALPQDAIDADGTVVFLVASDYLRETHGVDGEVADYGTTGSEAYISYRGPGYSADVTIDTTDGTYDLDVEQQGLVAVLNDLHKGRDTASSWNWLIDASAGFLIVVSLTGLGLQLFLSKRRRLALSVAASGLVVALVVALTAVS